LRVARPLAELLPLAAPLLVELVPLVVGARPAPPLPALLPLSLLDPLLLATVHLLARYRLFGAGGAHCERCTRRSRRRNRRSLSGVVIAAADGAARRPHYRIPTRPGVPSTVWPITAAAGVPRR